jgi:hypothetical protein
LVSCRVTPTNPDIAYSILRHSTWRWGFWVTLIIDAVTCIFLLLVYFPPTFHQKHSIDSKTSWQEFTEYDFIGTALFAGSVISLLLGINSGGSTHPWKSASTIAPIVIGTLGLVAFGFYEALIPLKAAFIPKPLLLDFRGFGVVILAIGVSGMLLYSLQILWPVMVKSEYTTDLTMIGWIGCTFAGGTTTGAMLLGFFIAKIGHGRLVFVVLVAMMTAFIGGMAGMSEPCSYFAIRHASNYRVLQTPTRLVDPRLLRLWQVCPLGPSSS